MLVVQSGEHGAVVVVLSGAVKGPEKGCQRDARGSGADNWDGQCSQKGNGEGGSGAAGGAGGRVALQGQQCPGQ